MPKREPLSLDLQSEYHILDLIFINSGSNHYVRLPVNQHAALLSDNNSGKTSSLSALKLFVTPEISFKQCASKFGFQSGGQYYSDIDSFQYYFPTTESYIICNASNPRGNFCWILYRSTDLRYDRIAIPDKSYDEIEHLFWNVNSDKNDGAGELQPNIKVNALKKILLSKPYSGTVFTDRPTIGEAIYTRTSNTDDHTRFSLLPMTKKFTAASVETVRAIFSMAFNLGNASTSSLPAAIGSIIDGMGMSVVKRHDDGIFVDIDNALTEWRHLKEQEHKLSIISEMEDKWETLKATVTKTNALRDSVKNRFQSIGLNVHHRLQTLTEELSLIREQVRTADAALSEHNSQHGQVKSKYEEAKADVKSANRVLDETNEKINAVASVRSRLGPLCPGDDRSDDAILKVIDSEMELCHEEIEALKDDAKSISLMNTINQNINNWTAEREGLNHSLESLKSGGNFFDSIPHEAASVLLSLNDNLAMLSFEPTLEQGLTIETFTKLFDDHNGQLSLCGKDIPKTPYRSVNTEDTQAKLVHRIEELSDLIRSKGDQLLTLQKNTKLTKAQQQSKLTDCNADLSGLELEKLALKGADLLNKQSEEAELNVEQAEALLDSAQEVLDESITKQSGLRLAYDRLKSKEQALTIPLENANNHWTELQRIENRAPTLLNSEAIKKESEPETSAETQPEDIDGLLSELTTDVTLLQAMQSDCTNSLGYFLQREIIESTPEDRHAITVNEDTFSTYFDRLNIVYDVLDRSWQNHRERLNAHNNTAATSARMIENVKSIIDNFINSINQEMRTYQISNLDQVELVANLHSQYVDMVSSLNRMTNRIDTLLSEEFYEQIAAFQNRFYLRKSGKIDIAKIIEKISYRFNRNGQPEAIPQSNGTNCMVNAVLLALLLKRMVPEDLSLAIPVVFDEVGSLDVANLREVLKVVKEHDLVLFAANPEPTGVIASVLDVQHDLSLFRAVDVGVVGKAESIYFPGMEERLEDKLPSMENEPALEE